MGTVAAPVAACWSAGSRTCRWPSRTRPPPVAAVVLLLLAAGCLHCAVALRAGPTRVTWLLAGAMAALMLGMHVPGSPLAHAHPGTSPLLPVVAGAAELLLLGLAGRALSAAVTGTSSRGPGADTRGGSDRQRPTHVVGRT